MKDHTHKKRNRNFSHEIKLFTDKKEMISYVNELTQVENVEIFKIEDQLYKVHVTRKVKEHECCQSHENEEHTCCKNHEKDDHECCHSHENEEHECCHDHENEEHECCQNEKKEHQHHGCCKDQE